MTTMGKRGKKEGEDEDGGALLYVLWLNENNKYNLDHLGGWAGAAPR